ncbi:MAG: glycosyltransferase, partial [bacterium]
MRIGLDIRALQLPYADRGVGSYIINIVNTLQIINTSHSLTFFVSGNRLPGQITAQDYVLKSLRTPPKRLTWFFEQLQLAGFVKNVDIFHSLASLGPLRQVELPARVKIPVVATVYDLYIYKQLEELKLRKPYFLKLQEGALKRCAAIITISKSIKNEINMRFSIPPEKIRVVYPS